MITSLVWLFLVRLGEINPNHAPWTTFAFFAVLEVGLLILILPKVLDYFDKRKSNKGVDYE